MPMACLVCNDPKRLEIDRALIQGGNVAKIARDYNLPYDAVWRHSKEHLSRQLAQAWDKKELDESFDLLSKIDNILVRAEKIFRRNYIEKKDGMALRALAEQRNTIDLLARISTTLHSIRLLELEMAREKAGEGTRERQQEFSEKLHVLTDAEFEMFEKLYQKVIDGTTDPIILDPPKKAFPESGPLPPQEEVKAEEAPKEAAPPQEVKVEAAPTPPPRRVCRPIVPPGSAGNRRMLGHILAQPRRYAKEGE